MLPPECQVCNSFDVDLTACCGSWTPSEHHGAEISAFVRKEYPGPSPTGVDSELFRVLNEDARYELASLYEDTTAWSAYKAFGKLGGNEALLPPGAARVAQTSAFVHIRVLDFFLTGASGDLNEARVRDYGVNIPESPLLIQWRDSINSNVMHMNKLRPRPVNTRYGRTRTALQNVHLEVDRLTDAVVRLWQTCISAPRFAAYSALTTHIDEAAVKAADETRARASRLLRMNEADIPWRP